MQRQGDLLIIPTDQLPRDLTALTTRVVLQGEHSHRLDGGTLLRTTEGELFVRVADQVQLVHEEHGPLALAPGTYKVQQQRRYRPDLTPSNAWD